MSRLSVIERFATDRADAAATSRMVTYTAWRILPGSGRDEAQPIEVAAATLAEAVAAAVTSCGHKDTFCIREADALTERATVHFYAVKRKSSPRYVYADHQSRRVHDLYAEPLFALAVSAFEPIEPWRWTPGADVVGGPRNVIDGGGR